MTTPGVHNWLVVMVKEPVAGRVKTRLGADIGVARATAFYRHATTALVSRLSCDPRWTTVLAVAPDSQIATPALPQNVPRVAQGTGDLGQRMQRIVDQFPPGPVVIVGSDCLNVEPAHIQNAFLNLGHQDGVIGPASDGGYWLIGLRRRPKLISVFDNVRWSTEFALQDTLRNMQHMRTAHLETLSDVDTGREHAVMGPISGRRVLPKEWNGG